MAAITLSLAWLPTAALAGRGHHHRHHHGHGHAHHHHGHHVSRPYVIVPQRIHRAQVAVYEPYYWGRVYHRPHRHYHVLYRFPVYTPFGLAYELHPYCGGRLFVAGHHGYIDYAGPRFHIAVDF